jgi:hypothetical protein
MGKGGPLRVVGLLLSVAALAACGQDTARTFGFQRDPPDEFVSTRRAPLSLPPDYALRPPTPGAPRPQELSARDGGEAALLGVSSVASAPAGISSGEEAFLRSAGPAPQVPSDLLRRRVDEETRRLDTADRSFADRLIFWRDTPPPGIAVDAQAESQRLRTNAALGQAPSTGDTPIIQRRRRGLLEGIF